MHVDFAVRLKVAVRTIFFSFFILLLQSLVYAQNAVVVKLRDTATPKDRESLKAELEPSTVKPLSVKGVELWSVSEDKLSQIKTLEKDPSVEYIERSTSPLNALLVKSPDLKLDAQQQANLSHFKQVQAQVEPTLVKMDASDFKLNLLADVANPTPLVVPLSGTKAVKIDTQQMVGHGPNSYTVYGDVIGASGARTGDAVLSVSDGTVVGTIIDGADTYSLKPLGGDAYVVTRLDRTKLPPEEPSSPDSEPNEKRRPASDTSPGDGTTTAPRDRSSSQADESQSPQTTVRVLVAYTKALATSDPFITTTIQNDIAVTNKTYLDSGIPLTLQLAGTLQEDYQETNYQQDLNRLVAPNDGFLDDVHTVRAQDQADVVVLLVQNPADCGMSDTVMADPTTAFSLVNYSCAAVNYSFAHELGHLFGARHDYCVDWNQNPYPYGHGYILKAKNVRTIMAYPKCCSTCIRIGRWADPAASYGGAPLGTANREDDSLVLKTTCPTVSRFHTQLTSKTQSPSGATASGAP